MTGDAYVTTSWDDGHAADIRMADVLMRHGAKGTFYVAFNRPREPEIAAADVRRLVELGMEVGSHTWTHKILRGRAYADVLFDLTESKKALEDILGARVTSLSYPEGVHDADVVRAAAEAGYEVARTTVAFRDRGPIDPLRLPVTVEFERKSRYRHARHALRDGNVAGLARWLVVAGCGTEPDVVAGRFIEAARRGGGFVHLRARSWEIDRNGLWAPLERALAAARSAGLRAVTNSELAAALT